eukprot:m.367245 g.367245  ORF g.367245 m.367245 type:complete len:959 (-) comp56075_c0_seq2:202-3078(-)
MRVAVALQLLLLAAANAQVDGYVCAEGAALAFHTLRALPAMTTASCADACTTEPLCLSFDIGVPAYPASAGRCYLTTSTRALAPTAYVAESAYNYCEKIGSPQYVGISGCEFDQAGVEGACGWATNLAADSSCMWTVNSTASALVAGRAGCSGGLLSPVLAPPVEPLTCTLVITFDSWPSSSADACVSLACFSVSIEFVNSSTSDVLAPSRVSVIPSSTSAVALYSISTSTLFQIAIARPVDSPVSRIKALRFVSCGYEEPVLSCPNATQYAAIGASGVHLVPPAAAPTYPYGSSGNFVCSLSPASGAYLPLGITQVTFQCLSQLEATVSCSYFVSVLSATYSPSTQPSSTPSTSPQHQSSTPSTVITSTTLIPSSTTSSTQPTMQTTTQTTTLRAATSTQSTTSSTSLPTSRGSTSASSETVVTSSTSSRSSSSQLTTAAVTSPSAQGSFNVSSSATPSGSSRPTSTSSTFQASTTSTSTQPSTLSATSASTHTITLSSTSAITSVASLQGLTDAPTASVASHAASSNSPRSSITTTSTSTIKSTIKTTATSATTRPTTGSATTTTTGAKTATPTASSTLQTYSSTSIVCDAQCLGGCLGPSAAECKNCANFQQNGTCVRTCSVGWYVVGSSCLLCDPKCGSAGCVAAGPSSCVGCAGVNFQGNCVASCPNGTHVSLTNRSECLRTPGIISGLSVSGLTSSSVKVSWLAVSTVTTYRLVWVEAGSGDSNQVQTSSPFNPSSDRVTIMLTGFGANKTYVFQVMGIASDGFAGPASPGVAVFMQSPSTLATAPTAAGGSTSTLSPTVSMASTQAPADSSSVLAADSKYFIILMIAVTTFVLVALVLLVSHCQSRHRRQLGQSRYLVTFNRELKAAKLPIAQPSPDHVFIIQPPNRADTPTSSPLQPRRHDIYSSVASVSPFFEADAFAECLEMVSIQAPTITQLVFPASDASLLEESSS